MNHCPESPPLYPSAGAVYGKFLILNSEGVKKVQLPQESGVKIEQEYILGPVHPTEK